MAKLEGWRGGDIVGVDAESIYDEVPDDVPRVIPVRITVNGLNDQGKIVGITDWPERWTSLTVDPEHVTYHSRPNC